MPKNDETRESPETKPIQASPPPKRKGLLMIATVTLAVWLVILTSLAVYSVWG